MEPKRDDRRTQYSKRVIKESLFELMQEKPINKITVKELCERADVNRSTFYAYYTDIYDLDRKIIKEFFKMQRRFSTAALRFWIPKRILPPLRWMIFMRSQACISRW